MDLSAGDMRVALLEQRVITLEQQTQHLRFCLTLVSELVRERLLEASQEVRAGNAALESLSKKLEGIL
jgi:hypothetical protein